MSIFTSITKHFSVTAIERNSIVTITGIKAQMLVKDFCKAWETTSVSTYMFNKVGIDSITFYSFFVPDIVYALYKMRVNRELFTSIKVIDQIILELKTKTWFANSFKTFPSKLDYDKLTEMTFTLMPHQLESLQAYDVKTQKMDLRGYLLAADVGTGKSVSSTALAICLNPDVIIVVCPKFIIDSVWVDVVQTQFNGKKSYWKSNGTAELTKGYDFYIFNFEAIDKALEFFKNKRYTNPVIILDESHNFNSGKSLRTNLYLEMCKVSKSNNIIHCSGTAVGIAGAEMIPLFRALDKYFIPKVEERFKRIYKRSATRALEILNNRLGLISHKVDKSAVLTLTEPIRTEIKIKLPNAEKYTIDAVRSEFIRYTELHTKLLEKDMPIYENIYNEAIEVYKKTIKSPQEQKEFDVYVKYITEIRGGYDARYMSELSLYCNNFEKNKICPTLSSELNKKFKEAKSIWKYPNLVVLGRFLGNVLGRLRIELHSELVEHSGIDEIVRNSIKKTIVFSDYVDTIQTAKKYFEDRGFKPLVVSAETNKDVFSILEKFKSIPELNPLLATIKSLSTGVTLVVANTVIYLNMPFRSRDYTQSMARVHRYGQDTQVYLYDIILDTGDVPNLSTRLMDILTESEENVSAILGTKPIAKSTIQELENNVEEGVSLEWLIETEETTHMSIDDLLEYNTENLIDTNSILNW